MLVRIARRMFRSTVLGCAAGLLMALDGLHFVLSRTALLDIFLMLFVLAAFGALVLDRDARRRRWLRAMESGLDPSRPGRASRLPFAVPWWRLGRGGAVRLRRARSSGARCSSCPFFAAADHLVGGRRPALGGRPPAVARHASSTRSAGCCSRSWSSRSASTWRAGPAGSSPTTATTGTGRRGQRAQRAAGDRRAAEPVALPPGGVPASTAASTTRTRTSPGRGSGCCSAGRWRSTGPTPAAAAPSPAPPRSCCWARRCCGGRSCRPWPALAWFGIARRDWRAGGDRR